MSGKHPAARDFFTVGRQDQISEALGQWVRHGGEQLGATAKDLLVRSCSWRFWAKTPERGIIACGVIKNSSDAVGRPFPLLLMGTGRLDNWEDNWEMVPIACEGIWNKMEQVSSRNFSTFERLKEELSMLRQPQCRWSEIDTAEVVGEGCRVAAAEPLRKLGTVAFDQSMLLPVQGSESCDLFAIICLLHGQMKARNNVVPNSVFVGGLVDKAGFACFKRPLGRDDFQQLWGMTFSLRS